MEERLAKAKARARDWKRGLSPGTVKELSPIEVLCQGSDEPVKLGAEILTTCRRDRSGEVEEFGERVARPDESRLRVDILEGGEEGDGIFQLKKLLLEEVDQELVGANGVSRHL